MTGATLFHYLWHSTKRWQVWVFVLTALVLPLFYALLAIPKHIINQAIMGTAFPVVHFGYGFDQKQYLLASVAVGMGVLLVHALLKYWLQVQRATMAERAAWQLRLDVTQALRQQPGTGQAKSANNYVPTVVHEAEKVGLFAGDAFALPLFQGGTLLTILLFIFLENPLMALVAASLFPLQVLVVPLIQRRINRLSRVRIRQLRRLARQLPEVLANKQEAAYQETLIAIFNIRRRIYLYKFFIKSFNNVLALLAPLLFYLLGGLAVIEGTLSLGALFAIVAAHKELIAPWKELLSYYQNKEMARVKFKLLQAQCQVPAAF